MTTPSSATRTRFGGHADPLLVSVGALLALDVVGGLVSIAAGLHTVASAWGSTATLAAPVPMMVAQALLALAARRWPDRRGAVAAGLLAAASVVNGVSGFFDGQFAKPGLAAPLVGFQVVLVIATLGVAALAGHRALRLFRRFATTARGGAG